MIMADQLAAAIAPGTNGFKQGYGIDFEAFGRIFRYIGRRQGTVDVHLFAEKEPAYFSFRGS